MTTTLLSMILFFTFTVLAAIHFYWFFGGTWALEKVIPTKTNKPSTLSIPKFATLIVALGLASFGLIYLIKSGLISFQLPALLTTYAYWIIPSIFTLRAIGEFNYVGFFKKIKNTEFAKADSKIFAPLCLSIGIIGFLIQLMGKY